MQISTSRIAEILTVLFKLTFKLDVRGKTETLRDALIRRWQLDYRLGIEYPSRCEGPFHEISGLRLQVANLDSELP